MNILLLEDFDDRNVLLDGKTPFGLKKIKKY